MLVVLVAERLLLGESLEAGRLALGADVVLYGLGLVLRDAHAPAVEPVVAAVAADVEPAND